MEAVPNSIPKNASIILLDDVVTTGNTLAGAMATIRLAGFSGQAIALTAGYTVGNLEEPGEPNEVFRIRWDGEADRATRTRLE